MSTDDYLVDPLRDLQVREYAKNLRHFLGRDDDERIDPLEHETASEIWTIRGKRPFRLEIVPDAELPGDSGLTTYDGSTIVVKASSAATGSPSSTNRNMKPGSSRCCAPTAMPAAPVRRSPR